jgi:tetratricopeptide (TPR) repeat protein
LRINPKYAKAHYNLGLALGRQGNLEEAMSHYREAVRIDPRYTKARRALEDLQRRRQ